MDITRSTCLSRNLFQYSPSFFRRIYNSVRSGYILSHLLSCSQLLFYLEIVLTNCTVLISEKNYIKLSRLLLISFLEVLPVLLSRETVPLDSVIWCPGYCAASPRTGEGHHLLLFPPSALNTHLGLEPSLNYL